MSHALPQYSRIAELFIQIEEFVAAMAQSKERRVQDEFIGCTLILADAAGTLHLPEVQQSARSMGMFLDGLRGRDIGEQDRFQLHTLFGNVARAYHRDDALAAASPPLVTPVAPRAHSDNNRVALYIESRAIAAMLGEVLRHHGFAPFPLESMKALGVLDESGYPAAVVADLALCQRDPDTHETIVALRERFSPPPHLFTLAGGADVAARVQAVRLGATRFMKKPVDTDKLVAILKGVTERTKVEPFRVLFIDDDRAMTEVYEVTMQAAGAEVRTLNDPLEAPGMVADFAPDVIVTDVYMPGCNGLELAALLRQDEALADTPILFLSSETNIQRQMAALDLGGDDFLSKPVNLEVLQAAVIARCKRARMLKRSRREYLNVVEHLQRIELAINQHSIVSVGDLEGNILYANQYFCDISGYTPAELLGANHRIVKSGQHPPEFYREMWTAISGGGTWHGQVCNRRKDGSLYWVDATITPQIDENGKPVRYVSVRTDITPLKEMQAQLMIAKAEAEAASQAKSVFLAHMSHELKTPLNSILGFSQLLQDNPAAPLNPDQSESVDAIERAGRHLLELISDLVDLAKIDTGHLGLDMEEVGLAGLVSECLALLKPQAQRRGIALSVAGAEPGLRAWADRIRVKQVLLNLLSNAVKYNRDKGSVTVSYTANGDVCHVSVRDTGPGISREDQEALFQPFSRLRDTASQTEGTGIGLALSRSLIERMGGKIGVISQPGAGSEFWFEVPGAGRMKESSKDEGN